MTAESATSVAPAPVAGAVASPAVLNVLASLPASFSIGTPAEAVIHAVDGGTGWADVARRTIESGTRVVVVTEPGPDDPERIEALAAVASAVDAVVILGEGWAGNPLLVDAVAMWPDDLASGDVIEADLQVSSGEPDEAALLALVRMLRAIDRPLPGSATVTAVPGGVSLVVRDGIDTWSVLAVRTAGPDRAHLCVSGDVVEVDLELPSPATAAPGVARRIEDGRELRLDAPFETGHRAAWRRAATALAGAPGHTDDLTAFAADVRTARAVAALSTPTHTQKDTL